MSDPTMKTKTIGSWKQCDLVIEEEKVSPVHAHLELSDDGHLTVLDAGSDHGSYLQRNGQWIRIMKVELGQGDRLRFADREVALDELVALFGERVRIKLRDSQALRIPTLLAERLAAAEKRVILERPKRNPETGNIEEDI
ncbi:MAG TPA: FHA domain-containing protein [Xanthomonadales bacterium]|nr:FHA domain-containing protein [Xanthomonadales bacterium]